MITVLRAIPVASLRLLVFDLDGTLIDSGADLCHSINAMLEHFGRALLPQAVIASYIGDGAGMLVRRALGDPDDQVFVDAAIRFFLDWYREHKLDNTYVYPGVFASLEALSVATDGRPPEMAVLTNKPVGPARAICEGLGLSRYFSTIYGGDSFHSKKPDPHGLLTLIRKAAVRADETLMVGDSDVDVLTARNAGSWSLGCKFGLSPHTLEAAPPDVLVDSADEWREALRRECA